MDCGYKWEDEVQTDLGEMIIYQSDEGVRLDVRLENKTVWLNQEQIGALFNKSKATISEHISNIFKEGELDKDSVCRNFRRTATDGKSYNTQFYNLDAIISVGYRANSRRATLYLQKDILLATQSVSNIRVPPCFKLLKQNETLTLYLKYHLKTCLKRT
jgi:hypothetical protein